ncbi:MAG: hypothetical protein GYB31_05615 [Bacteroidetes bacterium]|nr:hypothetical protein [Bacteroidota bacterium]
MNWIYILIVAWLIFSIYQFLLVRRTPKKVNSFLFQSIPGVFTTLGILGTFIGITIGLFGFDPNDIDKSIPPLLEGMKVAFLSSIIGISLSILFSWIVKYYLNKYGDRIPVPDSEESKLLQKIVSKTEDSNNHLQDLTKQLIKNKDSFKKINSDSSKKLLEEIQNTNKQLVDLGERQTENSSKMVNALDENHKLMREKFDKFAELLSDANTEALREAMEKLVQDFNDTFKELVEGLIDQNFERLSNSIETLTDWQEQHRTDVENLNNSLRANTDKLTKLSEKLEETYNTIEKSLENTSSSLENITLNTHKLVSDDGDLIKIVQSLNTVLVEENKLTASFDKAVGSMDKLLNASEEFEAVKKQITNWLKREIGVHAAMVTFNEGIDALTKLLEKLERIKMEDLRILDNSFDKRIQKALSHTFAEFDALLKEYVKFLESNRKIEIQVTEK